ncbi:MAG: Hpt domain-containing protein [Clostridiales bacterium]|jgi:HPt (histidine-containing phosphotransfer) domain-containing protein|nr:Hpt domain-containing protein [Clostridiales bacterium]
MSGTQDAPKDLVRLYYIELRKAASWKDLIERADQDGLNLGIQVLKDPDLFAHSNMSGMLLIPIDGEDSLKNLLSTWNPRIKPLSDSSEVAGNLIDIQAGFQNSAEDPALYQDLMRAFIDSHENDDLLLLEALASGDKELATVIAHTLATTSATVGAIELSDLAREMHDHISDNFHITDPALLHKFRAALSGSISELRVLKKTQIKPPKIEPKPEIEALPEIPPDTEDLEKAEIRMMPWEPTNFSKKDVDTLTHELRPLLAHGDTRALTLLDTIREVLGFKPIECDDLMRFIRDFDFFKAERLFEELVSEIQKTA